MKPEKLVASREGWHKEITENTNQTSRTVEIKQSKPGVSEFLKKLEASRQASEKSDTNIMVC
jgi:hypothetical protein